MKMIDWLYEDEKKEATSQPKKRSSKNELKDGYRQPISLADIKEDENIKDKIRVLKRSGLALPFEVWDEFVVDTVHKLALLTQHLPGIDSHRFDKGLVLHALDVAIYSMRIRRNYIMPPNTEPENVVHREYIWVFGVFVAVMLDNANLVSSFDIEYLDDNSSEIWGVGHKEITAPYRYKYKEPAPEVLGMLHLNRLFSQNPTLLIFSDTELINSICDYLSKSQNPTNIITLIITQAKAASVAQDGGADKDGINAAAKTAKEQLGRVTEVTPTHEEPEEEADNTQHDQDRKVKEKLNEFMLYVQMPHAEGVYYIEGVDHYSIAAFTAFTRDSDIDKDELIDEFVAQYPNAEKGRFNTENNGRQNGYKFNK